MALSKAAQEIDNELAAYQERMKFRQAPGWMPEPGTTVRVKVVGLQVGISEFGNYPKVIYEVVGTGEIIAVHAFHQTLRERLAELKTNVGVEQWLTYVGKRESRSRKVKDGEGQEKPQLYHLYDVENVGETVSAVEEGFAF